MTCQHCSSTRILHVSAHASDLFNWTLNDKEGDGYLPNDFGIGGGDDLYVDVCLDCGQVQGEFPLPLSEFETTDD